MHPHQDANGLDGCYDLYDFFLCLWTQLHTSIQEMIVEYRQWFNDKWPSGASMLFLHHWEHLLKLEIALFPFPLTPGSWPSENPADHKSLRPFLTLHDKNDRLFELFSLLWIWRLKYSSFFVGEVFAVAFWLVGWFVFLGVEGCEECWKER